MWWVGRTEWLPQESSGHFTVMTAVDKQHAMNKIHILSRELNFWTLLEFSGIFCKAQTAFPKHLIIGIRMLHRVEHFWGLPHWQAASFLYGWGFSKLANIIHSFSNHESSAFCSWYHKSNIVNLRGSPIFQRSWVHQNINSLIQLGMQTGITEQKE